jgi:hypothetical protein
MYGMSPPSNRTGFRRDTTTTAHRPGSRQSNGSRLRDWSAGSRSRAVACCDIARSQPHEGSAGRQCGPAKALRLGLPSATTTSTPSPHIASSPARPAAEDGFDARVEFARTAGVGYGRRGTSRRAARLGPPPPSQMRSVVASANPPATAGPAMNPRYMSVVADPTAVPRSARRAVSPDRLTIVGAHTEQPAPARTIPAIATGTEGAAAASAEPPAATSAPTVSTDRRPRQHWGDMILQPQAVFRRNDERAWFDPP